MRPGKTPRLHVSRPGLLVSFLLLAALVAFSLLHIGEARRFALLAERAEPFWLLMAVGLQVVTYFCAGAIWGRVAAAAGHRLSRSLLARLSVEKLSVDQFLPAGGITGNFAVIAAMRRKGIPSSVATEALLIDIVSHYAAFAGVVAISVGVLWAHHGVTSVILALVAAFGLLVAGVPLAIAWLLRHRDWEPGPRLSRFRRLRMALGSLREVSASRVWNPRLLLYATALQAGIVLLDAATLWATLHALGMAVHPLTAFVALVIATIAGSLTLLPGGVGSFEAGCIATLALLGASKTPSSSSCSPPAPSRRSPETSGARSS